MDTKVKFKTNDRIEDIDILKGIGILCMIMGHIGFSKYFDYWIHAFHMPMFFVISGYLFSDKKEFSIKEYVKRKAKKLLLPYVVFGVLQYIIWLVINMNNGLDKLEPLRNLFWINTNLEMPIAGALWFLTCLFTVEIVFIVLNRAIVDKMGFKVLIIVISILGTVFTSIFNFRLPFAIDTAMVALGLYFIGYEIAIHKEKEVIKRYLSMSLFKTFILFTLFSGLIFVNGYINLRTGNYAVIILFWLNSTGMTIVLWNSSRILQSWKNYKIINRINSILMFIGKNSIVYLCLNQIIILYFRDIFFKRIASSQGILYWIGQVLILQATISTLYIVTQIIIKTKLKYIIGK